jgi:hypothetical protein
MSTIATVDTGRDDMNFSLVHVIHDDCSFRPNKENQIPLWVNCNRYIVQIIIHVTKLNISFPNTFSVLTVCFNIHLLVA